MNKGFEGGKRSQRKGLEGKDRIDNNPNPEDEASVMELILKTFKRRMEENGNQMTEEEDDREQKKAA